MEEDLCKLIIQVPSEVIGEALGELNRRGAWLDNAKEHLGFFVIETRVPQQEVSGIEQRLRVITNGKGDVRVVRDP